MKKRQERDIVTYLYTMLLILLTTAVFGVVWYIFYNGNVYYIPFGGKGNDLVIADYCVRYWYFAKL